MKRSALIRAFSILFINNIGFVEYLLQEIDALGLLILRCWIFPFRYTIVKHVLRNNEKIKQNM